MLLLELIHHFIILMAIDISFVAQWKRITNPSSRPFIERKWAWYKLTSLYDILLIVNLKCIVNWFIALCLEVLITPMMMPFNCCRGVLLQGKQQLNEAILSFQRAIHFRPSLASKYLFLFSVLKIKKKTK